MREIKFRAKRKDTWEWVYGSYTHCHDENGNPSIIPQNDNRFVSVIPETVGQYSNKLDSELMDVFEGDIVQGENGKMWEVIYSLKAGGWIISNKRIKDNGRNKFGGDEEYSFDRYRHLCLSAKMDTFKKIGNVFDNPELLNPASGQAGVDNMKDPNLQSAPENQEAANEQAENAQESASQDQAMESEEGEG
jgi:hypothetical protein